MMETTAQHRLSVVWVDDSQEAIAAILTALRHPELKRTMTTMKPLDESVDFHPIVVDPDPRDTLFERVENDIRRIGYYDVVMVDLSFDPQNRTGAIDRGRSLALHLKNHLDVAVGVYTKHALRPRMRARVHSDGFDLVFDEIRQLYEDEESLTGDDWYFVFANAAERRHRIGTGSEAAPAPAQKTAEDQRELSVPSLPHKPAPDKVARRRPAVFIGSSTEALSLANTIQEQLRHECRPTVWTQIPHQLSYDFLTSFLRNVEKFEFGVFVFSLDDLLRIRDKTQRAVRDNVIFELGVFIGALGRNRTYVVAPESADDVRVLTDLIGLTPATYREEDTREEDEIAGALGPACTAILKEIRAATKAT